MNPTGENGATAVEYALIVSAVAAVIVAVVIGLGAITNDSYNDSCTKLSTEMGGDC